MKNLIAGLLVFAVTIVHAGELKSFDKIYKNIQSGKDISLVINLDDCTPRPSVTNIAVYTKPQAVMLRTNYLQFANSFLTANNPQYSNRPVLENVTYKLSENNELKVLTRIITLPDYAIVREMTSTCQLGVGAKVFA